MHRFDVGRPVPLDHCDVSRLSYFYGHGLIEDAKASATWFLLPRPRIVVTPELSAACTACTPHTSFIFDP